MTDVFGARTTTNINTDLLAIDMSERIKVLEPDMQPFTIFSREAGTKRTIATKFSWVEDEHKPRFDQINNGGGYNATAEAVAVDNGDHFQEHDIVLVTRTSEQIRIVSVSGNTLTVKRGVGSTAAPLLDNDELLIVGSAQPENDRAKQARSNNPSKVQNYTQIWRTPFESSGSLLASSFQVAPADWPHKARMAMDEHILDIEQSLLMGRKALDTSGATERRTTGGALSFINTNQTDAGGELTEAEWNAFMLQVNGKSSKSKLALGSGVAVAALNKFPAAKVQTRQDESTYGIDVAHYISPFGSINLVWHKGLRGAKYSGYMIVVDMDEVQWRPLGNDQYNRDTKVLTNRQPRDQDGRMDEVLTEAGLEFGLEANHGVLTGITS